MQIGWNARKHGGSDEDIRHALRFPLLTTVPSTVEQETMMPRTLAELERAAADAEAWLDSLNADDVQWENPTDLRAIGYALEKVANAERELADAVAAARARGRSWATIGTVLGVSKQSASSRYSERHAS